MEIITIGGRPLVGLECTRRCIRLRIVKMYPNSTRKKRYFRWLLILLVFIGLDRVFFKKYDNAKMALKIDLDGLVDRLEQELNIHSLSLGVFWPTEVNRGRLHIHIFDSQGQHIAFSKFSLDYKNDERLLQEGQSLERCLKEKFKMFLLPKVINQGVFQGHNYLITTSLPSDAHLAHPNMIPFPEAAFHEYAGEPKWKQISEMSVYPWWKKFEERCDEVPELWAYLLKNKSKKIKLCRNHGDLGSENIFTTGEDMWLIDWECSAEFAPSCTDRLAFWLGGRSNEIQYSPVGFVQKLQAELKISDNECTPLGIALSLAFLHGVDFTPATTLAKYMSFTTGYGD